MSLSRDFTQVPAEDFQRLRSKFSIWFLLLAAKGVKLGKREYERLKLQGMVGAQHYTHYSDFRRRVLEVAEKELRDKASFCFDWAVGLKQGRTPVTMDLFFHRNQEVIEARRQTRKTRPELPLFDAPEPGYYRKLLDHGISPECAQRLQREEDHEFLVWVADRIEVRKTTRKKREPIQHHEKFCLAIIEGERANFRAEQSAKQSKAHRTQASQKTKRLALDGIRRFLAQAHNSYVYAQAWDRYQRSTDKKSETAAFISMAKEQAQRNPHFKRVVECYTKDGLNNKLVQAALKRFLVQQWDLRDSVSLDDFMAKQKYKIQEDPTTGPVLLQRGRRITIDF